MRCGLYGKVPMKRDFIALGAPRDFLAVWEPWMQAGVSASRQTLKEEWQQAFLTAPIWRFWLGAELCATTVAGAFMPSLDGIGRYFPLTLFACAEPGTAIPPPELDAQDDWFAQAEALLLSTLDEGTAFETITAALDELRPPLSTLPPARSDDMITVPEGMVAKLGGTSPAQRFATMRTADHGDIYSAATCWWTIGGEGYEALAMSGRRMPAPFLFTEMLTGRFAFGFE
jgi:type VI secretion system protein ImpM